MAGIMRNDFLDPGSSDDEHGGGSGYDSEAEDLRKGGRNPKRRRVESTGSDGIGGSEDEVDGSIASPLEKDTIGETESVYGKQDPTAKSKPTRLRKVEDLPGISKPLTKKNLVATQAAVKRSGVVYISRVPPFMKPTKLRSLLEPYGEINRIFLSPEDPASHTKRVRNGGNKKRSFTDGWVEFVSKAAAKRACELLNAQIIGGKKGTYYHDDVWNLLYLKGFKWNNLTEQIAAENAERASRMRAEISKTTKENKDFVQNVERAKMLEGMEAKKVAKRRKDDEDTGAADNPPREAKKGGERARQFKQTAVAPKRKADDQPDQVKRVLSKIF